MNKVQILSCILAPLIAASLSLNSVRAGNKAQAFIVTIKSVATNDILKLADGTTVRAPIAPGVYAILSCDAQVFQESKPAGEAGLESLAEDGNAEPLKMSLAKMKGVIGTGQFVPGQPFELTIKPGDRLAFATMFVQSNDKFYATDPKGIDLFSSTSSPITGNLTRFVKLWDAGTEKDEAPGSGPNQALRQPKPNTGASENGVVTGASDGFAYPNVDAVIQLTVSLR